MLKKKLFHKDLKEEKWYQASVWFGLAVFSFLILCVTTFNFVKERDIIRNGYCIEASYTEVKYSAGTYLIATYIEDNGTAHKYNLFDFSPVVDGDIVRLYYTDYIENAVPQNTTLMWAGHYFFFGAMLAFNIWRVVKIYKKPYYVTHQIEGLEG